MKAQTVIVSAILLALLTGWQPACGAPQTAPKPQANRPPFIEQIGGPTNWSPETTGQFMAIASDPDGDKLSYTWMADNGTLSGEGDAVSWTSPGEMGKYKITVIVKDGRGGEAHGTKDVKVIVNADGSLTPDPPVVLKMSIPSSEIAAASKRVYIWTSSPIECVVTGADSKDLKFAWTASNGRLQGKGLNEGAANKVTWMAPGVGGDFTVDVVAADSRGNQVTGTVKFKVYCCGNY